MTISAAELVRRYGHAVVSHNAALFVGAGLSSAAGYPGWVRLLDPLRQLADVPASMTDLPLVAQYITARLPGGREVLTADILGQLAQVRSSPSAGHEVLRRLAIEEIWTTNYDPLIEEAIPDARVIVAEEDLLDWRQDSRRRILKMHGSTSRDRNSWVAPPVITRTDYETYQSVRQRTWAALQATFLTKSMLFLGFSFLDPNIEVLLRLSRSLNAASYGQHFTVLRQPTEADETSLFDHQVADLEASGITVCLIEEYDELNSILIALERRSREPALFVSGWRPVASLCV